MPQTKIMSELDSLLKKREDKYFIDGILNKRRVIEDLHNYDPELISLLQENNTVRENFILNSNTEKIIKINDLIEVFEMNDYWDDSYTAYQNKIGLTSNGNFLTEDIDIVLDYPYKDTVLKATMTKEEVEKEDLFPKEPYLNEKIAKVEIDTFGMSTLF